MMFYSAAYAQIVKPSLGVNGGVGMMYLIEQIEFPEWTDYQTSIGMSVDLELAFEASYFDLAVNYVYMSSRYRSNQGIDPFTQLNGISNNALFFSLSHVADSGWIRLGYQFGFGMTNELDEGDRSIFGGPVSEVFPSAHISGLARIPLGNRLTLSLKPMLLWSDVVGTFRYNEWGLRGEDVHFFTQFGLCYTLVQ